MKGLRLILNKNEKFTIGKDIVVEITRSRFRDGNLEYFVTIDAPADLEVARDRDPERFNKVIEDNK